MAQNTLGSSKIHRPVFQSHTTNDPIVPFGQAKQLRERYCSRARPVQRKTFNTGHITTVARGDSDVSAFLADRVSGKPATTNC